MKISFRGIDLIKRHEGLRLTSYKCPAGVWTIGYGHTGNVEHGETITEEVAEELLRQDLLLTETQLNKLEIDFNQNQFDALISFIFNVGWGAFRTSTLLKEIRKNINGLWYYNTDGVHCNSIREQFKRWKYGGGRVLPGLVKRREDEANLYLNSNVLASSKQEY